MKPVSANMLITRKRGASRPASSLPDVRGPGGKDQELSYDQSFWADLERLHVLPVPLLASKSGRRTLSHGQLGLKVLAAFL